jgi:uncharacterized protein (UPF0264 family)
MIRALKELIMTTHAMSATGRTTPYRHGTASPRARTNTATLIALTLFLAVLIAEAVFLALNAPSLADLGALAAVAGSVP